MGQFSERARAGEDSMLSSTPSHTDRNRRSLPRPHEHGTNQMTTSENPSPKQSIRRPNLVERQPLRTSVVGSYSVPEWLGRFNTDFQRGRISAALLTEIHETAIKAAIIDQETAGIDIVSDGEFRRDNDMDYFLERLSGVVLGGAPKSYYYDYYDAKLSAALPEPDKFAGFGLVDDLDFLKCRTSKDVTISLPGAFSLSRRLTNETNARDDEIVRELAGLIHTEARRLSIAGATRIQLDEPYLAGHPEQIDLAIAAVNIVAGDIDAHVALHVCYGNRYARPAWEGHYDFLFPAVLDAQVDELVLEFARKGLDDLRLIKEYAWPSALGLGVIDVKSPAVETPDLVAARIRRALEYVDPARLVINPDCGLRHLAPEVARSKLRAMVSGAAIVRSELTTSSTSHSPASGDHDSQTSGDNNVG